MRQQNDAAATGAEAVDETADAAATGVEAAHGAVEEVLFLSSNYSSFSFTQSFS